MTFFSQIMADSQNIFNKRRLKPNQLREVSERRFDDAKCLVDSGDQKRANGAMYLAGFVIECLLKALLLERHSNLQVPVDPAQLSPSDREVFDLLYRHELDAMIVFLPELNKKLSSSTWRQFQTICEEWTVHARYSPLNAKLDRAKDYLNTVKEVKRWLREL